MSDVFDPQAPGSWSFRAEASSVLQTTQLAAAEGGLSAAYSAGEKVVPQHDAAYWAKASAHFDFSQADRVPPAKWNRVLWRGLMNGRPFPALRGQRGAKQDD